MNGKKRENPLAR